MATAAPSASAASPQPASLQSSADPQPYASQSSAPQSSASQSYAPQALGLSASSDPSDQPYRALSRGAIVSLVLAVLAVPGLVPAFEAMLVLSLVGLITALFAFRTIRRYPNEYSGRALAIGGMALNGCLLFGGVAMHTYVYLTEVPEGYERVSFYALQTPEGQPDAPTAEALAIDGKDVFLKGYIHPASGDGELRRFVLVPDLGTCCFGGEPRSSSMIEVTLTGGQTVRSSMMKIKLAGKFVVNKYRQTSRDFDNAVFYRLQADMVN
ncbi:DUF3299 domain-containing protein [Candidatus Laterigemmans baculatus]|uniref:DUF3299 domain-containing protein n=1 Tax=Candidatus Laterigemmans baculatus TaxID=2770505 RepID=UPI0013DA32C1|nr:DUF3299 domain-containing protein [Candidatus Laterigemmans baculatus]